MMMHLGVTAVTRIGVAIGMPGVMPVIVPTTMSVMVHPLYLMHSVVTVMHSSMAMMNDRIKLQTASVEEK